MDSDWIWIDGGDGHFWNDPLMVFQYGLVPGARDGLGGVDASWRGGIADSRWLESSHETEEE